MKKNNSLKNVIVKCRVFILLLYSICLYSQTDFSLAPNSYIFDINDTRYGGLYIPVNKAYTIWANNNYFAQPIPEGSISASLYWEDVSGLIKSTYLEKKSPVENSRIQVLIDRTKGKGNALISLHVGPNGNSTDPIYWSWHIWVTDDPTQGIEYGHHYFPERDIDGNSFIPKFMDRNLGATSNNFLGNDWHKSGGLYYQWGRKDPFPPMVYKDQTHYNVTGSVGNTNSGLYYGMQQGIIPRPYETINDNIKYATQHPFEFINPPANQHWFSDQLMESRENNKTFDLWGDALEGIRTGAKWNDWDATYKLKSPFDPCPDGWRVPSFRSRSSSNGVDSPWGGQSGEEPNGRKGTLIQTHDNTETIWQGRYSNVKFYPALGIDFITPFSNKNVSQLGKYSLSGRIWKYDDTGNMKAQDQFSETLVWGATAGGSYARHLHLQSTAELSIRHQCAPEKWFIGTNLGSQTYLGNSIRCIQDPNRSKLNDYSTQFIPANEFTYTNGLDNPNSYIVKNNETQIRIPVNKAYAVYNQYLTDHGWPKGNKLFGSIVWSTTPAIIKSVYIEGGNENAFIVVNLIENTTGNASVALHIGDKKNSKDPIYWSWHIWVPKGDPEINTITYTTEDILSTGSHIVNLTNTGFPPLTTTFMDRDLGAEYAFPKELIDDPSLHTNYKEAIKKSGGLHYQWGRKDPLPVFFLVGYSGNGNEKTFTIADTDTNGNVTYPNNKILRNDKDYTSHYVQNYDEYIRTAGIDVTDKDHEIIQKTLTYSINNPLTFMANRENSRDWLINKKNMGSDRWGHGTKKSVFDPCPEGWRVPDQTFAFGMFDDTTAKGTSPWYNGRSTDSDGTLGIVQHGVSGNNGNKEIVKYYKGVELSTGWTAGWIFKNMEYPIGAYPINLLRRSNSKNSGELDAFTTRTSGLWSATMDQGGNGIATIFFGKYMNVGNSNYPTETAMSIRCAKDEARYIGTTPPPNSWFKETSVEETSEPKIIISENDFQVYPTPNKGLFTIKVNKLSEGEVSIINIYGKKIYSKNYIGDKEWLIDIQDQPAGIYIVRIQSGLQAVTMVKKIIKI